jgi:hypothetical protein
VIKSHASTVFNGLNTYSFILSASPTSRLFVRASFVLSDHHFVIFGEPKSYFQDKPLGRRSLLHIVKYG